MNSTLLLAVCLRVLGTEGVLALSVGSAMTPGLERARASRLAEQLGARDRVVPFDALANRDVVANRPDRGYRCKRTIFECLLAITEAERLRALVRGSTFDDQGDYRLGMRAAAESGMRALLLEAGFTKTDVRVLSRGMELPTRDLPSIVCLASRIPHNTPLTFEALERVDAAEPILRKKFSLWQVRVCDHFSLARIEVPETDIGRLSRPGFRRELVGHLEALGYRYVTLDLQGLRGGSMNEALANVRR